MGMITAIKSGLTRVNVQAQSDTAIAAAGLGISAAALAAVGKGNAMDRANGQKITRGVQAIRTPLTQEKARDLGAGIGTVIRDAQTVEMIKKPFIAGCKAYVSAAKGRAEMASAASQAGQTVAQINASAQHQISEGHVKASFNTAISQAASRFSI